MNSTAEKNRKFAMKFSHSDKIFNYSFYKSENFNSKPEYKLNKKKITLNGLGFKVEKLDNTLIFSLGYSSKKTVNIPAYVSNVKINKNFIVLESFDSVLLGNFCQGICNLKTPNVYKLKGLILEGSRVTKKEVKKK